MSGPRSRPPGAASSLSDDRELSRKEAAEYIASLLDGLRLVVHNSQLRFSLEEANNEKAIPD